MKIKDLYEELADKITPSMLLLTEATSLNEGSSHSMLDNKAEERYESLYRAAANSRLNKEQSLSAIQDYVKPLSMRLSAKL